MALDGLFSHLPPDEREAALNLLRVQLARRRRRAAARHTFNVAMPTRSVKRCPRCLTTKPATEFGISRTRPDGLQGYCKACR